MFWFGRGIGRQFLKEKRKRISPTAYLILSILSKKEATAKEIIDNLIIQFQGLWKPNPGTIYPMLSKLEKETLIKSTDTFPKIYSIIKRGLERINFVAGIFNKEIKFFEKFARFVCGHQNFPFFPDLSRLDDIYYNKLERYRDFLKKELNKVENILKNRKMEDEKEESGKKWYRIPIK